MSLYKRGRIWWYSFVFAGKRIQDSAKTSKKTIAAEVEKKRHEELERALAGLPTEDRAKRINTVNDIATQYLVRYKNNHRSKSILFAEGRLKQVRRLLGSSMLTDLNEDRIQDYIRSRLDEGVSGRTINMELGELSRAIGKHWSVLWPKVRKLEERKDVGRALSHEEELRLLEALPKVNSPMLGTILRIALLTGTRSGEILEMQWEKVDFDTKVITVGRSKSEAGTGRQIPMGPQLFEILQAHASWFANQFGRLEPDWYLFPFGSPAPNDPTRRMLDAKTAWESLREIAKVKCRFHDLRHTTATKMAEQGVPESTMLSILGHMSRAMLERYSHIRMKAKRAAMEGITLALPAQVQNRENEKPDPKSHLLLVQ